jgi:hypothetical protein
MLLAQLSARPIKGNQQFPYIGHRGLCVAPSFEHLLKVPFFACLVHALLGYSLSEYPRSLMVGRAAGGARHP